MKITTNPYNPYKEKGGVFTPTQQEEFQNSHLQNALDGSIVAYVPFILLQHHKVPKRWSLLYDINWYLTAYCKDLIFLAMDVIACTIAKIVGKNKAKRFQ